MSLEFKIFWTRCQDVYVPKHGAIDIDGAYFGPGFPMALMQAYPELSVDEGPDQYIPKLYGFKIFGMRGSNYEFKFDEHGNQKNQEAILNILENKKTEIYEK